MIDLQGRRLKTFANQFFTAGSHEVSFNGSELASGVYLVVLETEEQMKVQKVALIS